MQNDLQTIRAQTKEKIVTLATAAFGIVAALAWNEAIQSLFAVLFPKEDDLTGKFVYAVLVTVVVVVLSVYLSKVSKEKKDTAGE